MVSGRVPALRIARNPLVGATPNIDTRAQPRQSMGTRAGTPATPEPNQLILIPSPGVRLQRRVAEHQNNP